MQNLIRYIFPLLFLLSFSNLHSADKDKIYTNIKNKFEGLESIQLNFYDPLSSVKGEITAAKDDKYIISLYNRTIISNGKTIWNYSKKDANVLISSFNSFDSDLSVESLFFELLDNFKPLKLTEYSSSKGISGYKLYLTAKDDYDNPHNINNIELIIDSEKYEINEIIYNQDFSEYRWIIANMKINPKVKNTDFDFEIRDGIETIDLR